MTDAGRTDIVFAVSEAVSNTIEHAYPPTPPHPTPGYHAGERGRRDTVEVTMWTENDALCIEITDHGTWQPPTCEATGRGLSIPAIHRSIESLMIGYDARGTRVLLRHPPQAAPRPIPPYFADVPITPVRVYDHGGERTDNGPQV